MAAAMKVSVCDKKKYTFQYIIVDLRVMCGLRWLTDLWRYDMFIGPCPVSTSKWKLRFANKDADSFSFSFFEELFKATDFLCIQSRLSPILS